jgi:glutamine amidotransferase
MSQPNANNNFIIVDTGCANLNSVKCAVERLGFAIEITDDSDKIKAASKVILPGVGNAKHAMENLKAKGLIDVIQGLSQPVLGFCLGMQMMTSNSSEGIKNGEAAIDCLGVIPTEIKALAVPALQRDKLRLPHMGWNTLTTVSSHPVLSGIKPGDYFYFVHSFAAPVSDYTIAQCDYGQSFSAAIAKDNFIGCQFHPERSGKLGSKIINNFLSTPSDKLVNANTGKAQ